MSVAANWAPTTPSTIRRSKLELWLMRLRTAILSFRRTGLPLIAWAPTLATSGRIGGGRAWALQLAKARRRQREAATTRNGPRVEQERLRGAALVGQDSARLLHKGFEAAAHPMRAAMPANVVEVEAIPVLDERGEGVASIVGIAAQPHVDELPKQEVLRAQHPVRPPSELEPNGPFQLSSLELQGRGDEDFHREQRRLHPVSSAELGAFRAVHRPVEIPKRGFDAGFLGRLRKNDEVEVAGRARVGPRPGGQRTHQDGLEPGPLERRHDARKRIRHRCRQRPVGHALRPIGLP